MIKKFVKQLYMMLFHPVICFSNLSKNVYIGTNADIRGLHNLSFGKNVRIGNHVRIQSYSPLAKLELHNDVYMGNRNSFLLGGKIIIQEGTLIASDVLITSENHGNDPESTLSYGKQPLICKDTIIGEGCWIGEKVVVLPGVSIGNRSIVGAGSIVTKDIPAYSIAVGNPAKVIKQYNFDRHAWEKLNN